MPLSPPAGKPKGIKAIARPPSPEGLASLGSRDSLSDSASLGPGMTDSFFGPEGSRALSIPGGAAYPVIDSPHAWPEAKSRPNILTRVTGRYGPDGDLDDEDFLEGYQLNTVEVDLDEFGLRSEEFVSVFCVTACLSFFEFVDVLEYNCAIMCKARHSGRIHRLCLSSSHAQ